MPKTSAAAPHTTHGVSTTILGCHDDDRRAEQCGQGVQLPAQHLGHLVGQHVAHQPAADRGDQAHDDGSDRRDVGPADRHECPLTANTDRPTASRSVTSRRTRSTDGWEMNGSSPPTRPPR